MSKLNEFRERFNLVEYCKARFGYVKSGANILINCQYHEDHTPSMLVDPQRAYCFSCQKSVEAIDFVGHVEGKTRGEILRQGVGGSYIETTPIRRERVVNYFKPDVRYVGLGQRGLAKNPHAQKYLASRGVTKESITEWKLGYMRPPLAKAEYPRFSFPCYDINNELVSLVYRADPRYEADSRRKYIIHPQTPATIFGVQKLASCRGFLYSGGQLDAILLNQIGFCALGVSGEGTFKLEWAKLLRGLDVLYLILDNDSAGRSATKKVLDMLPNAVSLEWPIGTDGYDVADLIMDKDYGEEGIRWMLKNVGANEEALRKNTSRE